LTPENTNIQTDCDLDVSGLSCPLPILRTKKALAQMKSGQILRVLATDPGAARDFPAFAAQSGNTLLSSVTANGAFEFFLKRK
jgi:tRNA 2-thiouridine synthesizing protein A